MSAQDGHPYLRQFVRFGVPALILLFYLTAVMRFGYTPESSFAQLVRVQEGSVGSLWEVLLALAELAGLDLLLTAKVFSLFFACCVILVSFLIANEILRDYIIAFSVALCSAFEAWMLLLAPSGSSICLALLLSLIVIFLLLRNEYLLASIVAGLATMAMWQAALLFVVVIIDVMMNAKEESRSRRMSLSMTMVYGATILPWILYSLYIGRVVVPDIFVTTDLPLISLQFSFEAVMLVGLIFIGVVVMALRDRMALRTNSAPLLWVAVAGFTNQQMMVLVMPVLITYAFLAVQQILASFRKGELAPLAVIGVAAGILAYGQFVMRPLVSWEMDIATSHVAEMRSLGTWLKLNAEADAAAMPLEHSGALEFFSGKKNGPPDSPYIVSNKKEIAGYSVAYDPAMEAEPPAFAGQFKIWKKTSTTL